MRDAEKTVGNMIDKLKTAFIGSIDSEGFPNMKAMLQPRKREGIKTIYLTTNTSSMRVAQYRENNHACIYFPEGFTVTLSRKVSLLNRISNNG